MAATDLAAAPVAAPAPRRRARLGLVFWAAIGWIVALLAAAALAGLLPLPSPDDMDMLERRAAPTVEHWLGTDGLGRDVAARLLFGARTSLVVGLCAPLIGLVFGGAAGMLAGYFRGRLDTWVSGGVDVLLAFPPLVLALAVTAFLGQSLLNMTLVLGFLGIPAFTRVARAATLALAQREFVTAARALGATHARILLHELLPNVALPLAAFVLVVRGGHDRRRKRLELSRPGRATAAAELGQHDRRRARKPGQRGLARVHARRRDVRDGAGLQPRGRHAARGHRSAPGRALMAAPLLQLSSVGVQLSTSRGPLRAVDDVTLSLEPGTTLGIVGESGSGKTMLSRAILRLLPANATLTGSVLFDGQELTGLSARDAAAVARALDRGGLPRPDDVAQPGADDRHPDRRDAAGAPRARRGGGTHARDRAAHRGRPARARAAPAPVSAPPVRRHAAARGDRDRTVVRARGC